MNKISKVSCLFLIFVFFFGCKEDNPTGPLAEDFAFPLKIGNKWEYARTFSTFNIRGDTTGINLAPTIVANVVSEIVRMDTLPNSVETFVFHTTETFENLSFKFEDDSYYKNQADGLFLYAHSNQVAILLKSAVKKQFLFQDRYFKNIREILLFIERVVVNNITTADTLIIEDPPFKSLQYPLEIGSQWIYSTNNFATTEKKVLGKEKVETPAGDFDCIKIQWIIDFGSDIEFFDFICSKGLVKRSVTVKDIRVTTPDNPDGTGVLFDSKDEFDVINFNLE